MRRPWCALWFLRAGVQFLLRLHFAPTLVLIFVFALLIRGPYFVPRRICAHSCSVLSGAGGHAIPCATCEWFLCLLFLWFWWYCVVMAARGAPTASDCPTGGEPQDFVYFHRPAKPLDEVISYLQSPSRVQARRYVHVVSNWFLFFLNAD